MEKRIIYARELLHEADILHLAKEFYRYIYRYPELEEKSVWKEIKKYAEEFLVIRKQKHNGVTDKEDYREFLRFYTSLETRFYDEERRFIFTEQEKSHFLSLMKTIIHI